MGFSSFTPTDTKTSAYVPSYWQDVFVDASGGDFTVTTPAITISDIGKRFRVIGIGTDGATTVSGAGDTIDGAAFAIVLHGQTRTYEATSTSTWSVVAQTGPHLVVIPTRSSAVTANFGEKVPVDPSGGDFTLSLPPVASVDVGDFVRVTHVAGSGKVTVDADGSDEISKAGTSSTTKAVKKGESFDFEAVASSGTIRWFVV